MSTRRLALIVAGGLLAAFVLVFGSMSLLSFLMSDPPPDRSEATLEFIAIDADDGKCLLNREDVAAGVHEFWVITQDSGATVELHDETGNAVFWSDDPQRSEVVRGQEGNDALELEEGRYTLVCRYPGGPTGETTLTVTAD